MSPMLGCFTRPRAYSFDLGDPVSGTDHINLNEGILGSDELRWLDSSSRRETRDTRARLATLLHLV